MSTIDDRSRTLADEVTALVKLGPDSSDEVNAPLKSLLNKFSATPRSESVGEALQLLGTAVGTQSKNHSRNWEVYLTVTRGMAGAFPRNRPT